MSDPVSPVMIDVGEKPITDRAATAEAILTTRPDVIEKVRNLQVEKGDALRTSEVAGLMGLKRTSICCHCATPSA